MKRHSIYYRSNRTNLSIKKVVYCHYQMLNFIEFYVLLFPKSYQQIIPGSKFHPNKIDVTNENEVLKLLSKGANNRRTDGTKMNSVSSRSHAIFTIYLCIQHGEAGKRESVINLVDLAGSEGLRKNGNIDQAQRTEMKNINESLLTLKRSIRAKLVGEFIPYRESVITEILRGKINFLNSI